MSEFRKDLKKHKTQLIQLSMKGMSLFGILESFIPGLEGLHALLEIQHQEKLDRFCKALLNEADGEAEPNPILEKAMAIDYFDLFRAFLQDNDEEKAEHYARLTAVIKGRHFDPDRRKHFVLALKSLTAKDLSLLRQCYLVKHFDLIAPAPLTSNGILNAVDITSRIVQGDLVSASLSRLRNFDLFNQEGVSRLGIEFIQATHHRDALVPDILKGERAWQDGYVMLITSKKVTSDRESLIQALKARRIRAETIAADQLSSSQDQITPAKALVFFEPCNDLIDSQQRSIARYAEKFPYHCIRVGPFTLPKSMLMGYRASLDAKDATEAADFIANQYGFMSK